MQAEVDRERDVLVSSAKSLFGRESESLFFDEAVKNKPDKSKVTFSTMDYNTRKTDHDALKRF